MHLARFFEEFYFLHRVNLGDRTKVEMLRVARAVDAVLGRETQLSDLSDGLLANYIKSELRRKISPAQINVRRGYLLSVWRFAWRNRLKFKLNLTENPYEAEVERVREPKKKPVAWSVEQINVMIMAASWIRLRGAQFFGGSHWVALLLLLYYTGLRIMAALQLKVEAMSGDFLFVPHDHQKDDEEMVFRLPPFVVKLLKEIKRPDIVAKDGRKLDEMLIPWPWGLNDPQKRFRNHILKPAGLPLDRNHKFHAMRKTVGTIVAHKCGKGTAQEVLGHSCQSVTERYIADGQSVDPSLSANVSPMDVMPELRVFNPLGVSYDIPKPLDSGNNAGPAASI